MKFLAPFMLAAAIPSVAGAVTVAIGSTLVGDAGGINAVGADVSISAPHSAYSSEVTTPVSEWVWVGDVNTTDTASFEFVFDLTGYDLASAQLSGRWGVDNVGEVFLNGNLIADLPTLITSNFNVLHDYGTSTTSYFTAGLNTLRFDLEDLGGPASFRATSVVTADAAAVPLPAGLLLLLSGLGVFGVIAGRARLV